MKKFSLSLAFGLIGLVFEWGLPFIVRLLLPGDGMQQHGEDEANRQLKIYFLFGGALFFVLWAWIGAVFAENRRKAWRMIGGVLLAMLVVVIFPRLFPSLQILPDDWRFDALFVCVWAGVSAAFAYFLGHRGSVLKT